MKNFCSTLLIAFSLLLVISSCSLQKRHYMQGYHISWKNSKHKTKASEIAKANNSSLKENEIIVEEAISVSENNEVLTVSNDNSGILLPTKKIDLTTNSYAQTNNDINEPELKANKKNTTQKPDEEKKRSGPGPWPGILFMLLGLLMVGLGYIFYTNLGVFIGTFFFLIFGIGGAIFFIIGIVALFVH